MEKKQTRGAPEGARRATGGAPHTARGGRFSAPRKAEAVQRLLRGEDLDTLSRTLGVTAATLSAWRDDFLRGALAALKTKEDTDDRAGEVQRLKAKIGELTMANELLYERCHALEAQRPLAWRRSKP